jgi:hypothetical protein
MIQKERKKDMQDTGDDQNYIMPRKGKNGKVIPVYTMQVYKG